jgi:penicillin-binding protein 1A
MMNKGTTQFMTRIAGGRTGSRKTLNPKKPAGRAKRIIIRLFIIGVFFGVGGMLGAASLFYYYSLSLPPIGPLLEGYNPPQTTRILSSDGEVIGELFDERRTIVPISRIPKNMTNAVIAAEDADFRNHKGVDYMGIARAVIKNLLRGHLRQGASTITQQVARTFFLTREKSLSRKIREVLLTKKIEDRLTKDEILFLYLNQINFGHARYGVSEAARFYFGKDIRDITLAEAALLAGIPKGPSIYSPLINPKAALGRRAYVLGEMLKNKLITKAQYDAASIEKIDLSNTRGPDPTLAPEAVDLAILAVKDQISLKELRRGGYTIVTTVDTRLMRAARQAVLAGLFAVDARHGRVAPFTSTHAPADDHKGPVMVGQIRVGEVTGVDAVENRLKVRVGDLEGFVDLRTANRYNPNKLDAGAFAAVGAKLRVSLLSKPNPGETAAFHLEVGPEAALAAIRPKDGTIAAIIGGDHMMPGGFDRASRALRQPGSAFKPIVYLAALITRRYTAATLLDDAPEVQGEWQPQNAHEEGFLGAVRARDALARSLNLPAVKLITEIGPDAAVVLAKRLGISSALEPAPSLALGASAVTPLEMASAYATLANRGRREGPTIIRRVLGKDGNEIPLSMPPSEQAVSEQEAYLITSLMESVVEGGGTGAEAQKLGRPAAGKTGTSNEQRDAWFVGYTPSLACAVWVGFDDFKPIGKKEYGNRAALPIWLDFMTAAHADIVRQDFEVPEGIVTIPIDPKTGLLAYENMPGALSEVFIEGTQPMETAVPPDLASPDSIMMDQLSDEAGAVDQKAQ